MTRKITEDRFELIRSINPAAKIEVRDGVECVVIRDYDIEHDVVREHVMELIRRDAEPKFKPGDVVNPGKSNEVRIVDPFDPTTWFGTSPRKRKGEGEPA